MQINEERNGKAVIVVPAGRIDSTTSAALEGYFQKLAAAGERHLVVDFGGVDYISSAGLRVMLSLAKRTKDTNGSLALCALADSVSRVFMLAGFLPLFTVTGTRLEAIERAGSA